MASLRNLYTRKFLVMGIVFVLIAFFGFSQEAFAQQRISLFDSQISVNPDASLSIVEEIVYNFGDEERRGIFRTIPFSYQTPTGKRTIRIDVQSVERDGLEEAFVESNQRGEKRIRIGDPDVTITGSHIYRIHYTVIGAINYFEEFDEVYWNVTGNEWSVPIDSARVELVAPEDIEQFACFKGSFGLQDSCDTSQLSNNEYLATGLNLRSGEGMTIAISMPKGVVVGPQAFKKFLWWLRDNFIIFLPIIVFGLMFRLWQVKGKDPRGSGTVIAQYEPPETMKPTLVGALVDEKIDNRDITAGLIWLAEQGYITIKRIEKKWLLGSVDYELTWVKDPQPISGTVESEIAEAILGQGLLVGITKNISELKKDRSFSKNLSDVRKRVQEEMVSKGLYEKNPSVVRGTYGAIGAVVIFVLIFFSEIFGAAALVAGILSGIIIIGFGMLMPKKTPAGALAKEHILGFKDFLSVTQKDRLEFHNAPERSPEQFMEFLPYAIAMGVEENWADQFKDIYIETPEWYQGSVNGPLFATALIGDLGNFTNSVGRSFTSAASGGSGTGGGGFSGGGFGGGGGGSW